MAEHDTTSENTGGTGNDIAIIGMAGRFPGSADVQAFWRNLREGVESIVRLSPEALEWSPLMAEASRHHPDFVPVAAELEGGDGFDAAYFGMAPREAEWMDPQQRVFLECAWTALEDAALDPERFEGKISLYAGASASMHGLGRVGQGGLDPASLYELMSNSAENLATRASFKLGLRGESLSLYTACSTGLVAVHMACQSLLMRQSDVALAGAVRLAMPQRTGYLFQEGMILSPDGHCRAFDARAAGTVPGNGAAVVVLKPLEDALRDGDRVYAVIRGSSINNDGAQKVGYTAPSVEGQADVIGEALAFAGLEAGDIGYVEAHGTGTALGDPIEVAALTRAYRRQTDKTGYCALGSVKTNVGHLDTAAGLAGLIKTALALTHEELPPTLHFERPNPAIDFAGSPFFVVDRLRPWPRGEVPRRAGVSSFGIGGTNAHAVLEEAPVRGPTTPSVRPTQVVMLSGRSPEALEAATRELAGWLESAPADVALADVAFTRNVGRRAFEHRRSFVARDLAELREKLLAPGKAHAVENPVAAREQGVAFLFPGQGAQSVGMGRELHAAEPVYREALESCLEGLGATLGAAVRGVLLPSPGAEDAAAQALADPGIALPALFSVEYALARQWEDWGVHPRASLGHSFGEYVAACLAEVLPLEDGLALVAARGRLMARMPPGSMTAVGCAEETVRPLLTEALSLAAVNGPDRCVVSGPTPDVEALERELVARGVGVLRLPAAHAFHSAAVEPLMAELRRVVAGLRLSAPQRPYVSSVTGTWIRAEEATDPDYWLRQMRAPVRFGDGLETLKADGCTVFLEVGPDQALTALSRLGLRGLQGRAVASLPRTGSKRGTHASMKEALGALWEQGLVLDWRQVYAHETRRRVALPTYPFQRKTFRVAAPAPVKVHQAPAEGVAVPPVVADGGGATDSTLDLAGARTEVERKVLAIWRERLGRSDFGIHDDFLELGGNSLMAAQLLTRLREAFPVPLPLSDVFDSPTVAGISARIQERLGASGVDGTEPVLPPLVRIPRDGDLPLSVVQGRVCALEQALPGNPALNMYVVLRLQGALDVAVLERSLEAAAQRHEALRTSYPLQDGVPVLRIAPELAFPLTPEPLAGATWQQRVYDEVSRPFDLERGPVARARLWRLEADDYMLAVTIHHVVCDTWSLVVFAKELGEHYAALKQGHLARLPALPVQYVDFAAWQRKALKDGAFASQISAWRERLAAFPSPLELPVDRPRGEGPALRGQVLKVAFPAALSASVQALAQREGVTPFMVLLASWKALLSRWTGRDDIVVGTPIGNRSRPELEPLVGYVAHAVPLRTDLAGAPSFRELLMRVRDVIMEAYAHPDVPYEELGREIEPTKDTGRARVFDTLFVLHSRFDRTVELPGVRMSLAELDDVPPEFGSVLSDLTVGLGEHAHGFSGTIDFAEERFERETVERLVAHWTTLLEAAVAEPETVLSALPLEQPRPAPMLAVETGSSVPVPVAAALQVRADSADATVAMTAPDGRSVTWGELRRSSERLAAELTGHGVGPEVLVAVCLEPSVERVVAQWAVQALGAAYVLLSVPQLRELASLSSPGAPPPLLLTHTHARTGVALDAARVIRVDEVLARSDVRASEPPREAPRASAGDMVCLEPLVGARGEHLRAIHTHHTVAELFARLDAEAPSKDGIWLAAEEAQAPGSGLELLWALTRGLRVVLPAERARFTSWGTGAAPERRRTDFSLSFFANDEDSLGGRKYRLLLEAAKFADANGFSAVWTPERHFHSFGGLYPRPAVVGAGVATVTERLGIRAGSVVLPLHDPILVAEEWAVLDNLSDGRVGVSFASGWHANDFVFAPDRYARRKEVLHRGIEEVRTLWRGGTVVRRNGTGEEVAISLRPKPVQKVLPIWLTAAGSPETFRLAGELGAYVLTNLMGQHLDDLASKVALYRESWRQHGHAGRGHVSLMMHAFLGDDPAEVQKKARPPLLEYFRGSVDISSGFLASLGLDVDPRSLSPSDIDALLAHGVERYMENGGLIGTPETCGPMVERVQRLDVDEIACLVDFGVEVDATLEGLRHLDALRVRHAPEPASAVPSAALREGPGAAEALLSLVRETGITHLHCTAALARSMLALPDAAEVLRPVRHVLLEGASEEAAASLARAMPWQVAHRQPGLGLGAWAVAKGAADASRWDVVDGRGQPVPVGVVGELMVTGAGVPRGFWNAPETTSMRVLAGDTDGSRRLVTGRRARRKRDGSVEFLAAAPNAERRPPPPKTAGRTGSGAASKPEVSRPIPLVPRGRPLPLSFAQQRLWYLDRLEPGNVAYNNAVAFTLTGKLDAAALERALNGVVRRHEALRTTFALEGDSAVQIIAPELEIAILARDVEGASEEDISRQAREEARRTFDLEKGPLLRATLLRLRSTEHLLLLTLHHIISDGWSAGVMVHEMARLYEAEMTGQPPSALPALPVQYADYALWQLEWMRGAALKSEQAWWGEVLADVPVLRLPVDRPRPPVQTYDGAQLPFAVPRALMDAVAAAGRKEGATPFMVLLAAWQMLLHVYTGQEDFAVGAPVAGRNRPEVEPLIGCFINSIALRADLSGDPSFTEVLGRVRRTALAAFSHQEMPFEKVLEVLNTPRDLSQNPVFQTMVVLHNTPTPVLSLADLQMSGRYVHTGATKLDLTLEVTETAEGLRGGIDFNTRLFDEATIARLGGFLLRVLEAVASRPESRLSQLQLLPDAERRQLMEVWRGRLLESPREVSLAELFEAQVAKTPDAVAVTFESEHVTYRGLEARANQLAHHLQGLGVGVESLVGVCLERSVDMVVALLGVLKAGAAYMPLDPAYPQERLVGMLEDSGATVLLTHARHQGVLASSASRVVLLDAQRDEVSRHPVARPSVPQVGPEALAYVIFTSGSTGRPKGAMNAQGAIVNRLLWMQQEYGLGVEDVVLQKTPFSFDVSVWEFFWPLSVGARLVVAKPGGHQEPAYLAKVMKEERVTTLHFVPPMLRAFLDEPGLEGLSALRRVVCSGEALDAELVKKAYMRLPAAVEVHNLYGPTEAAVDVSYWPCPRDSQLQRIPIGKPVANTVLYVLDRRGQPTPMGIPGELHIGGVQVGRGYRRRPELTAERFIPDAFSGVPGARMYRTGDVARWLPDGTLEYLGRADFQVKLRGFRIELGEVEAALLSFARVAEAVVTVREDGAGKRLVAYVVLSDGHGEGSDASALKDWVRSRLPAYMVPAAFVTLATLPRSRHGKVDRRALPAPEWRSSDAEGTGAPPRSAVEETLAALWREVLSVPRVGIHDDFFELGGDSILGLQMVTRARAAGIELSPKQLFQNPTVARLAAVAGTHLAVQAEQGPVTGPVALTPIQHWFFELAQEAPHYWNMSLLLEARTPLDAALLERALGHLLQHHDALRLRFTRGEDGWHQLSSAPGEAVTVARVDLSSVPEAERSAVLSRHAEEAQGALRLDGPLLQATIFEGGPGLPSRLMLAVHHLVVDAVSWRILLEDLSAAYAKLAAGEAVVLPPKTTSFQAWAWGLEALARSEGLTAQRAWWLERPWREVSRLPVDSVDAANTEATASTVRVTLAPEYTRALLHDVPKAWHTQPQEPLLTALAQALTAWAGGAVALVDVEGHGREDVLPGLDVSRTVGWFTRVFPALLDLRATKGPGEALRAVKEGLRAVPSQGMGWGLLRHVARDASLAALPPAEVMFNHLGQVDGTVGVGAPFVLAPEGESLRQRAPSSRRSYLLDVTSAVRDGRLEVVWTFSEAVHQLETVTRVAEDFLVRLRALVDASRAPDAGGHSPADFPLAKVKQAQLDKLAARFGKKTR